VKEAAVDLYLMQHGEARPEHEDPERPLTLHGREEVEHVAAVASRLDLGIAAVRHSGKLRARQTGEIVGRRLSPPPPLSVLAGLAPNDDPATAAAAIESAADTWLLVGHLPQLSRLLSLLVLDDASRAVAAFRMGALVALANGGDGWRLRWILTPELAAAIRGEETGPTPAA
jgi:phosphohistidine phosphatase